MAGLTGNNFGIAMLVGTSLEAILGGWVFLIGGSAPLELTQTPGLQLAVHVALYMR